MSNKIEILRIPIMPSFSLASFDPTQIHWAVQSNFVRSTFSPLVSYGSSGNLEGELASEFWWSDEGIHFKIRKNAITSKGRRITPDDVVFSFKRSILLNQSTHGSLKNFFLTEQLESIDSIFRIISDSEILIRVKQNSESFLQTLSNPEMSIIPRQNNIKNLGIDYSNTTGVYFVTEIKSSEIYLQVNKKHFRYTSSMADTIILKQIDVTSTSLMDALDAKVIDVIPTWYFHNTGELIQKRTSSNDFNIHRTIDINLTLLKFSEKGVRDMSLERRKKIAKIIKLNSLERAKDRDEVKDTFQFFSIYGESLLSKEQENQIRSSLMSVDASKEDGDGLSLYAPSHAIADSYKHRYRNLLPKLSFKVMNSSKIEELQKEGRIDELPDIFFAGIDAGFSDNVSLINYAVEFEMFSPIVKNKKQWLKEYMSLSTDQQRKIIKDLHFESLKNFAFVPIYITPYVAIGRKPWKFKMSRLTASTPYWMIQNE